MKHSSSRARTAAVAVLFLAPLLGGLAVTPQASAQGPSVNMGRGGLRPRFFNSTRYDSASETNVGQTKLVLNAYLDMQPGPVAVTVEQSGRAVMSTTCRAQFVSDTALHGVDAQAELWECATDPVDASTIRSDQPVDIVLATPGATPTEFYRGTFPVLAFREWTGNRDGRPQYVEQRGLRLDSLYGAVYVRQYASVVEFSWVTTQPEEGAPSDVSLRCRVGNGAWTSYGANFTGGNTQVVFDRAWTDDGVVETKIVTAFYNVSSRMPIAVPGRSARPSAGSSLDGAWTCELRAGEGDAGTLLRSMQFTVQGGFVQRHAIEAQIPGGRGAVLASVGFNPEAMPTIFDPAIVRSTLVGRRLASGTTPVVAGMPTRATNPAFAAAAAREAAPAGRGRPRRSR